MYTTESKKFNLPPGKWKHVKKSYEWEKNNRNGAKGMVGEFSEEKRYLVWQSDDGKETLFMEVKEIRTDGITLYIRHRSGLEYWFTKEK